MERRLIGTRSQYCQSCFNVFDFLAVLIATAAVTLVPPPPPVPALCRHLIILVFAAALLVLHTQMFVSEWVAYMAVIAPLVLFARSFMQSIRLCIVMQRYALFVISLILSCT